MKYRWLKRVLCVVGLHWEGVKGLGMYGDANRCDVCGADAYGLLVLHGHELDQTPPTPSDTVIAALPAVLNENSLWPLILYQTGCGFCDGWVVQPCIGVEEHRNKIAAWLREQGYRVELSPPDTLDDWTMNIYRGP
jgi:hypothetical protein